MIRLALLYLVLAGALAGNGVTAPIGGVVPDDTLTPGEIATSDLQVICMPDYSRAHRQTSYELKEWVAREYGVDRHAGSWEIDHRIPLCLGGADTAANLWPEPGTPPWGFRQKDDLEWYACRAVCDGQLPLATAIGWFRGDWRQAYRSMRRGVEMQPAEPSENRDQENKGHDLMPRTGGGAGGEPDQQ